MRWTKEKLDAAIGATDPQPTPNLRGGSAQRASLEASLKRATAEAARNKLQPQHANQAAEAALEGFATFTDPRQQSRPLSDQSPFLFFRCGSRPALSRLLGSAATACGYVFIPTTALSIPSRTRFRKRSWRTPSSTGKTYGRPAASRTISGQPGAAWWRPTALAAHHGSWISINRPSLRPSRRKRKPRDEILVIRHADAAGCCGGIGDHHLLADGLAGADDSGKMQTAGTALAPR